MVRESGISATKPVFPLYLLPSLKIPFYHNRSSSRSETSSSSESPSNIVSPDLVSPTRLSRIAPDTLRCLNCSADLAFASQIISKGFTGRYGRAYLVAPLSAPTQTMLNVRVGRSENRQLATGWHVVADITCESCASKLGWKYVDAKEQSQKYKVGKYILETERVVTYRNWEDVAVVSDGIQDSALTTSGRGEREHGDEDEDSVSFDSGDEDECEDVFAGTWDPEVVSMRRNSRVASSKGRNGSG